MRMLNEYTDFVKRQGKRAASVADRCPDSKPLRKKSLQRVVDTFEGLAEAIENTPPSAIEINNRAEKLALTPKDIAGLPDALIEQLSLTEGDRQDFEILDIIEAEGGVLSIDHVIIALYRRTDEIPDRAKINARLYRMTSKSLLYGVPGKKGVYSITPVEDTSSRVGRMLRNMQEGDDFEE